MRPEVALRNRILENPDIVSRVGTRIYPVTSPFSQVAQVPYIIYQRVGPGPGYSSHGEPSRFGTPLVQISVFSRDVDEAWELAEAARDMLDGWSDPQASPRIDGVTCGEILEQYEDDTRLHQVFFDATVRYGK